MGDPTRINILWALEKQSFCVSDLAVLLNMTKSAVSHQLKILRTAKLVRADKKAKTYAILSMTTMCGSFGKKRLSICANKH